MATPPARTELADTYPAPSNATFRTGIGKLYDYVTALLGASGSAADARIALGAAPLTGSAISVFDFMTPAEIYAVENNQVLDVTTAVQAALTDIESKRQGRIIFPRGDYRVTQITLGTSGVHMGVTYEFQNATIVGISATPKKSIVQIKCGSANIFDLVVAGGQNANYECGVHWYTNNLNTFYPGLNRIDGMIVNGCLIGLCIGALPSQADPIPAQGTAQADGIATDAPISECYVGGLRFQDCITGVHMRQPNGKLTLTSPTITTSNAQWPGTGASAEANCNALYLNGSELTVLGGYIENIDDAAGALALCQSSTLNIVGAALEGRSAIRIAGRSAVNIGSIQNWGMNNDAKPFFMVLDSAEGYLNLSGMFLRRGYGTASTVAVVKTVSSFTTESGSANGKFWVNADNVEFGDCNFTQGATYNPLVFGCRAKFKNCWVTAHSGVDPYPITRALKIDEGTNLLAGKVDLPADVITAYGVNAGATSGGWIFTNAAGTCSWGRDGTSLPTIEGITANNALRLTAPSAAVSVYATSPKYAVEPQRTYLVKGWIKTNAAGAQNIIRVNWYDFSGAAASTASTDLYTGAVGPSGTVWMPFMLWAQAPKDATQAELFLYSENGSELWTVNLGFV